MTVHVEAPVAIAEVGANPLHRLAYSVDDAAELFSVTRATIYRWITAGKISTVKLGGCRRIPRSELERVLAEGL